MADAILPTIPPADSYWIDNNVAQLKKPMEARGGECSKIPTNEWISTGLRQ